MNKKQLDQRIEFIKDLIVRVDRNLPDTEYWRGEYNGLQKALTIIRDGKYVELKKMKKPWYKFWQ